MMRKLVVVFVAIVIASACASSRDATPGPSSTPPPGPTTPPTSPPTPPPAPAASSIACGGSTCGPNEYCESKCTCCGAYPAPPGKASGTVQCKPIAPPCTGIDFCNCA